MSAADCLRALHEECERNGYPRRCAAPILDVLPELITVLEYANAVVWGEELNLSEERSAEISGLRRSLDALEAELGGKPA